MRQLPIFECRLLIAERSSLQALEYDFGHSVHKINPGDVATILHRAPTSSPGPRPPAPDGAGPRLKRAPGRATLPARGRGARRLRVHVPRRATLPARGRGLQAGPIGAILHRHNRNGFHGAMVRRLTDKLAATPYYGTLPKPFSCASGSVLPVSWALFPAPYSLPLSPIPFPLFPIPCPCSLFPNPYSLFAIPCPYSLFPNPYSLFPIPCPLFPLPTAGEHPRKSH
jgi:hypothetical protein